jgi:hypothetical protein
MHSLIGLLILAGVAAFVGYAFRQGMGVRREHRRDDGSAFPIASDSGSSHHGADSGGGHSAS